MDGLAFDAAEAVFSAPPPDPAEGLLDAIREKNYPAAYRRLRALDRPLSGRAAGDCLAAALGCSAALFGAVLARCEPGEHAAQEQWRLRPETVGVRYVNVKGTILTIAAAMNRTKHMKLLLGRGWDVNAGSPASAQALRALDCGFAFAAFLPTGRPGRGGTAESELVCGRSERNAWARSVDERLWRIERCTPLAAAIACGSVEAVRLLLRRPEVQTLDSSAVCAAAVVACRDGEERRDACLRLAFGLKGSRTERELLGERALDPAAILDVCTLRELTLRLKGAPCPPEQLLAAVRLCRTDGCEKKLLRLLALHPELGREREVRDVLLERYLSHPGGRKTYRALLERWKELCGEERDVSNCPSFIVGVSARSGEELRALLRELGEGGRLVAAAESAWIDLCATKAGLELLTEHVRFYRAHSGSISNLAMHILDCGDARFLRRMAARGALDGEPREELLAYLREKGANPMLRAAVLSTVERRAAAADELFMGRSWSRRTSPARGEERQAWLAELWRDPPEPEECRRRFRFLRFDARDWGMHPDDVFSCAGYRFTEEPDGMQFGDAAAGACCGGNPELLRMALDEGGVGLHEIVGVSWTRRDGGTASLDGTLLCAAAAAGRTEQVRLLLDRGADPNERDAPRRSSYTPAQRFGGGRLVVTPLYMALEMGRYETAELLRRRGAVSYPPREEEG